MHILSLNTWGGRAGKDDLLNFFKHHADTVDVFCLQEIWSAPYEHLEGITAGGLAIKHDDIMVYGLDEITCALPEHDAYFHPHHLDNYGLLMMVKKNLTVVESGDVFVYRHRGYIPEGEVGEHARNIQYATIETQRGRVSVINFHGLWTSKPEGRGKEDIPERIAQSENILAFTQTLQNPYVLCGDFNLLPTTVSIRKFEEAGLRNLITEYGITSTRTRHYPKPEKFADYAFVSPGVVVNDFRVLPDEVSDHSPLYLALELGEGTVQ